MGAVKTEMRRLQCLFEHCCLNTMTNVAARGAKLMFEKDASGAYVDLETEDLFALWLSGRNQGVADQAFANGGIQL
jgi:hypothetical protein